MRKPLILQDTQPCGRDNLGCNLGGKFGGPWDEAKWTIFFSAYTKILLQLADVVAAHNVEAMTLSTELSCATTAGGYEGGRTVFLFVATSSARILLDIHI